MTEPMDKEGGVSKGFLWCLLALTAAAMATAGALMLRVEPWIGVSSKPPGARVFLDGELMGQAPMTLPLDLTHEQLSQYMHARRLRAELPGFHDTRFFRVKHVKSLHVIRNAFREALGCEMDINAEATFFLAPGAAPLPEVKQSGIETSGD